MHSFTLVTLLALFLAPHVTTILSTVFIFSICKKHLFQLLNSQLLSSQHPLLLQRGFPHRLRRRYRRFYTFHRETFRKCYTIIFGMHLQLQYSAELLHAVFSPVSIISIFYARLKNHYHSARPTLTPSLVTRLVSRPQKSVRHALNVQHLNHLPYLWTKPVASITLPT